MSEAHRGQNGTLVLVGILSIGCLFGQVALPAEPGVPAGSSSIVTSAKKPGNADRGRAVFNGKGVCYYCHGLDGYRDKLPQLEPGTSTLIAQLNPRPADLRNPKSLRLTTDGARAKAIREGHPGTGMFPDTTVTDQEITDTLAYLALLRKEGQAKHQ